MFLLAPFNLNALLKLFKVEKHNLVGNLSLEEEEHLLCVSSIKSQGFVGYTHHSPHLTNGVVNHNGDVPKSTNCSVVVHNGNGEQLSPVAKTNLDIPDSKPVKLAPIFSPPSKKRPEKHNFMTTELHKAPEVAEAGESVKFETHLKTLPPEKMPKSKPTERKRKRKEVPDAKQPPKKRGKKSTKAKIAKTIVKASPSKASGSSRKSTSPKKKKQATLLELTKKKGGMMLMKSTKSPALGSSLTSPTIKKKPRATRQPPIVYHLINLKKEKNFRKNKYLRLLHE